MTIRVMGRMEGFFLGNKDSVGENLILLNKMDFIITPLYKDLFEGPEPHIDDLIGNISSEDIILYISFINARIFYSSEKDYEDGLMAFFIHGLEDEKRNFYLKYLLDKARTDKKYKIFSLLTSMEFLHYEFCHFRKSTVYHINESEKRFRFLQAYFIFSGKIQSRNEKAFNVKHGIEADFFTTRTWPIITEQMENSNLGQIHIHMIKGLAFLYFLQRNGNFGEYVKNFLRKNDKISILDYMSTIMNAIQLTYEKQKPGNTPNILVGGREVLLENLSLNVQDYMGIFTEDKKTFIGIKEFPLYKNEEGDFIVLNWNYIANKLFNGLIFDFYKLSGIQENFKKFPDFKNFIGLKFTERILQGMLAEICNKKHSVLRFDDKKKINFPDAYYRYGKYIFLFEIKDAYFPSTAIDSYSYEEIKKAIDDKVNTSKKGTGQLIKNLKKLGQNPLEDKSYQELNLKPRNLVVFPIIVYTDEHFGMPGVNNYLRKEFKNQLQKSNFQPKFEVKPITIMDLSFLMANYEDIRKQNLHVLLDKYHKYQMSKVKQFFKNSGEKAFFSIQDPLEKFYQKRNKKKKKNPNFVPDMFRILDLPLKENLL